MENKEFPDSAEEKSDSFDAAFEKRLFDAMAEFAAGVGHELNNPLAVIRGHAQMLLHDETHPDRRHSLTSIIEQTRLAYEMIVSVRAFARPPELDFCEISALKFFDEWTEREKNRREAVNIAFFIEASESLKDCSFTSDEAALATILDSFGKNAADALRFKALERRLAGGGDETPIGSVRLFATLDESAEPRLIFGIEDDGAGITLNRALWRSRPLFRKTGG